MWSTENRKTNPCTFEQTPIHMLKGRVGEAERVVTKHLQHTDAIHVYDFGKRLLTSAANNKSASTNTLFGTRKGGI